MLAVESLPPRDFRCETSPQDPKSRVARERLRRLLDEVDHSQFRTPSTPPDDRVDVGLDPLEGRLHGTVRAVANPAAEPELPGALRAVCPEEHALYSAGDKHTNALHDPVLQASVGRGLSSPKDTVRTPCC